MNSTSREGEIIFFYPFPLFLEHLQYDLEPLGDFPLPGQAIIEMGLGIPGFLGKLGPGHSQLALGVMQFSDGHSSSICGRGLLKCS